MQQNRFGALLFLFLCYFLRIMSLQASGPYYVDDGGSDANNGTNLTSPFLTIQHAVDIVSTGLPTVTSSTIYVCPGNYNENVVISSNKNNGMMVIKALSNERPVIYGSNLSADTVGFYLYNVSSLRVEHFIIKLFTDAGIVFDSSTGGCTNNYIVDNIICSNDSDNDANGGDGIGIWTDDCDKNYIIGNEIFGPTMDSGIGLSAGDNNVILSNHIYDVQIDCIGLDSSANSNIIKNNFLNKPNENNNIDITGCSYNTFISNQCYYSRWQNIALNGTSISNCFIANIIWSNTGNVVSIHCDGDNVDSNFFNKNIIYGGSECLEINNGDNNIVRQNVIYGASGTGIGIRIQGTGTYNRIVGNSVYSNSDDGIRINGNDADNNEIVSNVIWQNGDHGIYMNNPDDNKIYRNLIRHNTTDGIRMQGTVRRAEIINNTIFRNGGDGIDWNDTSNGSSGKSYNNICLSNSGWGINYNSDQTVTADYECTYGNGNGGIDSGITVGTHNNTADPYLETDQTYEIWSSLSSCIDNATNIPGVSDVYKGSGPDRGWKESPSPYTGPFYVNDDFGNDAWWGNFSLPFSTLQHAVDIVSAGLPTITSSTIYVFPGNYNESVGVQSNKNSGFMVVTSLTNNKKAVVYGSGLPANTVGIKIDNTSSVIIKKLTIKLFTASGIAIDNISTNNYMISNIICSNDSDNDGGNGISLLADGSDKNYILHNDIFGLNQDNGIYIDFGDNNFIISNQIYDVDNRGMYINACDTNRILYNHIYNSGLDGIYLIGMAQNNHIAHNSIYSNNQYGIDINSDLVDKTFIYTNIIYGTNQDYGIYVFDGDNSIIQSNHIFLVSESGIYLGGNVTNTLISNNQIYSNKNGVQFYRANNNICSSNLIYNNFNDGIIFDIATNNKFCKNIIKHNGNNGISCENISYANQISKNIIISNTANNGILIWDAHNIECFSNISAYNAYGLRIFAGSSDIKVRRNAVYHNNGYGVHINNSSSCTLQNNSIVSNGIFATYHGILIENSSENNEIVNSIIAGTRTGYGVSWDGTGSGNVLKYNDYYGNNSGATNGIPKGNGSILTAPHLIGTDVYSSNFFTLRSNSTCYDVGTNLGYSYHGIAPDMGWKESLFTRTKLNIVKSISNIISPLGNGKPIPGSLVIYKLYYTNYGVGEQQCLYDHLPSNVTFWTGYYGTGVTGWTLQYSTNVTPDNNFNSSDYTSTMPSDKTTIKWVRWKKSNLNNNELGSIYYEVVIK